MRLDESESMRLRDTALIIHENIAYVSLAMDVHTTERMLVDSAKPTSFAHLLNVPVQRYANVKCSGAIELFTQGN